VSASQEDQRVLEQRSAPEDALAAATLAVPELPTPYVRRPRLVESLVRAEGLPLVLVSAPAGTGKTALVTEWARRPGTSGPVGWVTFEESDTPFWPSVLACLHRLGIEVPDLGEALALGRQPLAELAASIGALPGTLTVVVDGYELTSVDISRDVSHLLRHTAGHLQLVLVGRVDPVLPLYRYRLSDDLAEIRVADLAFRDGEASELLRRLGAHLRSDSVGELNQRVRGWVAGLRFAGRALAGAERPEEAAATVVAQTVDINEYLLGEVLNAQTPELREFLLETCLPDVLCAGLVEELGGTTAVRSLAELERSNTFLEPVPDEPGRYRYYPLFRDLLRAQLAYEAPQKVPALHRKAADWFRRQGDLERAVAHLIAIAAWDDVAVLLVREHAVGRPLLQTHLSPLHEVMHQVPTHLDEPEACLVRAAVALGDRDATACARELDQARRGPGHEEWRAPANDDAREVSTLVLDVVLSCLVDGAETSVAAAEEAERALAALPPTHRAARTAELDALVRLSHGVALIRQGGLGPARHELMSALSHDEARAFPTFDARCLGYLAVVEVLEGNLARASRSAGESLDLSMSAGVPLAEQTPTPYVALARVALEQYDLEAARRHLTSAAQTRAFDRDPMARGIAEGVLAGLDRAAGQLQQALARLHVAAADAVGTDPWMSDCLRVEAAKLSVAGGLAERALEELEGVERFDEREVGVVAAAAYVETGHPSAVDDSLVKAHGAVPLGTQVSRLLVEAVRESKRPGSARTRVMLDRSLRLAAPQQLRRPFREAGPSVQRILSTDSQLLHEHSWLTRFKGSLPPTAIDSRRAAGRAAGRAARRDTDPGLVEPLTQKEREVLDHLQQLLTTEEIGQRMFVSVNTVRTHIRSILRKLGVNRRNAAVRRARDLGLFEAEH
jgi:LuxR family transcriptional regulator, maltose regulon positive regulatory protein